MIVTRKTFEKEVNRRAKRLYQADALETALELAANRISKLERRIAKLERLVARIRPEGTIKGFYLADDGKVEEVTKNEA